MKSSLLIILLGACTPTTEVRYVHCDAVIHQHVDTISPDTIRVVFDSLQYVNCVDPETGEEVIL